MTIQYNSLTVKLVEYAQMIEYDAQNLMYIGYGKLNETMYHNVENGQKTQANITKINWQRYL